MPLVHGAKSECQFHSMFADSVFLRDPSLTDKSILNNINNHKTGNYPAVLLTDSWRPDTYKWPAIWQYTALLDKMIISGQRKSAALIQACLCARTPVQLKCYNRPVVRCMYFSLVVWGQIELCGKMGGEKRGWEEVPLTPPVCSGAEKGKNLMLRWTLEKRIFLTKGLVLHYTNLFAIY